ncbi:MULTISPECIES: ABC transporter ATP-binding protein [Paenibacillus]|uniref:ABC transporter related protein n=2 Tax=Paenibacillus lactis TaxID=228574 RepID=G4HPD6_9BACL|nr:ABC transporter ATP-binding protein [Paenibacillus lactis]EHB48581.1 ABC transporter related protein [Paenibacillus lactis 154]MBP1896778.1 ABC-2 type transport system ATP-binding protein [Paenibacillus lactis]HAG00895.1 ABC transporter ATP-binding protein [Paenibacillus lactis]
MIQQLSGEPIVELKQVTKTFGSKKAVNRVSFTIERGSITAILGPNGAGKSTAISMMLGLKDTSEGEVLLFGQSPKDLKVREKIGAMLQEVSVMDGLRTREIINLIRSYYPNPMTLEEIAALSGLTPEELGKWAVKMSGGQKRKLSFALAIAGNPELLFFDEPTVGLDTSARRLFWQTVRGLKAQGKTILFTTHYLQEADDIAERIVLFHQGQVAADGTPEAIKSKLTRRTVSFIADADGQQVIRLLHEVPGVTDVYEQDGRLIAVTSDTDTALAALFRAGLTVRDIRIDQGSLDEAFDQLTMSQGEAG